MRRLAIFGAVLAAAAVLASAGSAGSPNNQPTLPTLYFTYAMNCTFTIVNDQGQTISQIPPGLYQVDVRTPVAFGTVNLTGITDMTACHGFPQFQLTGPGINLSTNMTAGCEADKLFPETFQPSATYVALDNNQPAVTRTTFTTAATGSPVIPASITASGKGQTETDLVGSGIIPTLTGMLTANGLPTLKDGSKVVTTLQAGRYVFAITDRDPKGSFTILGPTSTKKTNLTGVKFVGKHSLTITLNAGRWTYFAGGLANMRTFVVTQ